MNGFVGQYLVYNLDKGCHLFLVHALKLKKNSQKFSWSEIFPCLQVSSAPKTRPNIVASIVRQAINVSDQHEIHELDEFAALKLSNIRSGTGRERERGERRRIRNRDRLFQASCRLEPKRGSFLSFSAFFSQLQSSPNHRREQSALTYFLHFPPIFRPFPSEQELNKLYTYLSQKDTNSHSNYFGGFWQ